MICFFLLFSILLAFFWPTFSNPLRSDYWALFYNFHQFQELNTFDRALSVINYDVCGHGTYRPLFHVFLYWMYLLFGSNYFWYHLLTFLFYFLSVILLFILARKLGSSRGCAFGLTTLFAFLFHHFDIVAWTFHLGVIVGFCFMLLGFLLYLSYLAKPRIKKLVSAMVLFLPGMLCYEIFIFWPSLCLLLAAIPPGQKFNPQNKKTIWRHLTIALAGLMGSYGLIIFFIRSQSKVKGLASAPREHFSLPSLSFSLATATTGIAIEAITAIDPLLVSPGIIHDNIGRGGLLLPTSKFLREISSSEQLSNPINQPLVVPKNIALEEIWHESEDTINLVLALTGCILLLGLTITMITIWKRGKIRDSGSGIFILALLFLSSFTLYHGRLATNPPIYILLEFRYQYVIDALIMLGGALAIEKLLKHLPRLKPALFGLLTIIILVNILLSTIHIQAIKRQLRPLDLLLTNIKSALAAGRLSPAKKLYLEDKVAGQLPTMCWNQSLSGFMQGSYQWIFSPEEIKSFSECPEDSVWKIKLSSLELEQKEKSKR